MTCATCLHPAPQRHHRWTWLTLALLLLSSLWLGIAGAPPSATAQSQSAPVSPTALLYPGILGTNYYHTCALTPPGAADCWGQNGWGQATDQPGPYTRLAIGHIHTCGLTLTGAADCWGDNGYGQAADQPGPFTQLVAGLFHTCGLTPAGAADCWGDNGDGQAADQPGPYIQLRAGFRHTCGLTPAGAADCWGSNHRGQANDQPGPFIQLGPGYEHTCGLTPAGAIRCWGSNDYGQATNQPGPFSQLAAGLYHTCGLTPAGAARCWGDNRYGQSYNQPGPFSQLAAGYWHTCGLALTGAVGCWGYNGYGQATGQPGPYGPYVGNTAATAWPDGYLTAADTPLSVAAPGILGNDTDPDADPLTATLVGAPTQGLLTLHSDGSFSYTPDAGYQGFDSFTYYANDGLADSNVTTVRIAIGSQPDPESGVLTAGGYHTCGLTPTGAADCWGDNGYGQATDRPGPFTQLRAGQYHTCSLTGDGAADCWGLDASGQATDQPGPFTQLAAGHYHSCGLTPGGAADCWGDNSYGQAADRPGPYTQLRAGEYHTCGLTPAGVADCWGQNFAGQAADQPGPFDQIAAGGVHTCGLTFGGAADCWGDNTYGQATDQPGSFEQLGAGYFHSCGLTATGSADCWGWNAYGQAGDQPGPYSLLAAGAQHTCGLTMSGSADCWGWNVYGQANDQPGPYGAYGLPVAQNDSYGVAEDTALLTPAPGVLTNDTDANNDPLTALLVSAPMHGALTLRDDGSFDYVPAADYNGPDSFTYRASDGQAVSYVAVVNLMVTPVNDPPIAFDDTYSTSEDTLLTVPAPGILGNDTDVEGDGLTATLTGPPTHGVLTFNSDGSFSYAPDADYFGPDSFTYRAHDGAADSNNATVNLSIDPVNDPPTANDDSYTTLEDTPLTVAAPGVLGNDADVEGDLLTAMLVSAPAHGGLTLHDDGSFGYTPNTNYNGQDSFTYRASDGQAVSYVAVVNLMVTPVNDPPVAFDDTYSMPEDTLLAVPAPGILGNDTDVDSNPLTAMLVAAPTHGVLTLNSSGSFSYTPDADYFGPDSFTYRAHDGAADSNNATVNLSIDPVNDPPVANDDSYTTPEDTPLTVAAPGVLGNDADVEGDLLVAMLVSAPAHGGLTLHGDGSFGYTPNTNYNGPDSFTYRVTDGAAHSNPATVNLMVSGVNDPPEALDDSYSTTEDTPLTVTAPGVLGNDIDVEEDTLTAILMSGPSHGALVLTDNGSFTYTPAAQYSGWDSFTYQAYDGLTGSNIATVTVTIVLPVIPDWGVLVGGLYHSCGLTPAGAADCWGADSYGQAADQPGPYTQLRAGYYHTCGRTPAGAADCWGRNDYGQAADQPGPYIQLTAGAWHTCGLTPAGAADCWGRNEDGQATDQPGPYTQLSAGAWHTCGLTPAGAIDCWGRNNFGQAADQPGPYTQLRAGYLHTCGLTPGNAADCWGDNTYGQATDQSGPYAQLNAGGYHVCGLTPTGAADCWGWNDFGQATDQPGPYTQMAAGYAHTCSLTPAGAADCWGYNNYGQATDQYGPYGPYILNTAPMAQDGSYGTLEDAPLIASAPGVLDNDSDAEGNPLTAVLVSAPAHGVLILNNDGSFSYAPDTDYNGPDSFTYHAHDGLAYSNVATVSLAVDPLNDPPTAYDDSYSTGEDTRLTVSVPGVLGNDVDPDSDPLMVALVSSPTHGTLVGRADGFFKYLPDPNYNGFDSFTYRVHDGLIDSEVATVSLTILPVNDPPVAEADSYSLTPNGHWVVVAPGVMANDSDPDSSLLKVKLVSGVSHGTLKLRSDGGFGYKPDLGFVGEDSFVYQLSDGALRVTATVTLMVGFE